MWFKGKLINQTWENGKKPYFVPDLACLAQIWALNFLSRVLPLLDVRHCHKKSLFAISRKMYDPNLIKWQKTSFLAWFRPVGPKFVLSIFFSKIWLRQSLYIMISYHHEQYQKKLMIQSRGNLVTDERTDRKTDRRMRVISMDAVRLMPSVYYTESLQFFFKCKFDIFEFGI